MKHNVSTTGEIASEVISWIDDDDRRFFSVVIEEIGTVDGSTTMQAWALIIPGELVNQSSKLLKPGQNIHVVRSTIHSLVDVGPHIVITLNVTALDFVFSAS